MFCVYSATFSRHPRYCSPAIPFSCKDFSTSASTGLGDNCTSLLWAGSRSVSFVDSSVAEMCDRPGKNFVACKGIAAQYFELDPVPRVNSCPRGFCCSVKLDSSYQLSKIAEIFWVNQQGALDKQLYLGR